MGRVVITMPRRMGLRLGFPWWSRRARRTAFTTLCAGLLLALALFLFLPRPSPGDLPASPRQVVSPTPGEKSTGEVAGDHGPSGEEEHGGWGVRVRVEEGAGGFHRYVVEFPEPTEEVSPETSPRKDGLAGSWVLEMRGSFLGISNCRLYLLSDGTVRVPSSYGPVFSLEGGRWWGEPGGTFEAEMAAGITVGSGPGKVPVAINLKGRCPREGLVEGDFRAEPLDGNYTIYYQEGSFRLVSRD
jgi:hypothetical protein